METLFVDAELVRERRIEHRNELKPEKRLNSREDRPSFIQQIRRSVGQPKRLVLLCTLRRIHTSLTGA
jgi:hypothetical protein